MEPVSADHEAAAQLSFSLSFPLPGALITRSLLFYIKAGGPQGLQWQQGVCDRWLQRR